MRLTKTCFYLLMIALSLVGCSLDNENDSKPEPTIDPINWLDSKFMFKSDGTLDITPFYIFKTKEDAEKYLVGSTLKHVTSHIIKEDGTVEQKSYYGNVYGPSPIDYYFGSNSTVIETTISNANGGEKVSTSHTWSYIDTVITIDPQVSATTAPHIIQILEASEEKVWVVQLIGFSGENAKPLYAVSLYNR